MWWLLLAGVGRAQSFDDAEVPEGLNAQLLRPAIDSERTVWTNDSLRGATGHTQARLLLSYTDDPLVYVTEDGARTELVSGIWQADVLAGYQLGPVRLGVDVPIVMRSLGEVGGETGVGDIALDGKGTLLDRRDGGLGLALGGRIFAPTGSTIAPLASDGVAGEAEVVVDGVVGKVLLVANVGARFVPAVDLENMTWDDQLTTRLGVGYAIDTSTGLSADLAMLPVVSDAGGGAGIPAEALVSGWRRFDDTVLRLGAGTGITSGVGTPDLRLIAAFGYEPARNVADMDGDGVADGADACADTAEDRDGVVDTDGCPEPTKVVVVVKDVAGQDIPGANWVLGDQRGQGGATLEMYGRDVSFAVDAAGFRPHAAQVHIPDAAEYTVTVTLEPAAAIGTLVVRVVDGNGKAIPGATWSHPALAPNGAAVGDPAQVAAGSYEILVEAAGYRSQRVGTTVTKDTSVEALVVLAAARAEVSKERIDIKEAVYFNTGKATIKPESFSLLDEVAEILVAHPELKLVRIEGHTDSRGSAESNRTLSQNRAEAVRTYLVGKGVAADRLDAIGFGEDKPLKQGENEDAWSVNRRVDFFVVERTD